MSQTELLHTFKMMGINITPEEFRSLQELLPPSAISKEGNIDYRELFWMIQTQSAHGTQFYSDSDGNHRFNFPPKSMAFSTSRLPNSFPSYSPIPTNHSRLLPDLDKLGLERSILSTPIGTFVSTPLKSEFIESNSNSSLFRKQLSDLIGNVRRAVSERSRMCGTNYQIQKQFEAFDGDITGFVSLVIFQRILEDLAVPLSSSDIYLIKSRYGQIGEEKVDYLEFCRELNISMEIPNYSTMRTSGDGFKTTPSSTFLPAASRLSQTLRMLRNSGKDPRDIFQAYDLDNTGMVWFISFLNLNLSG